MFMFVPTDRYPEYCFTPGVVSQIPELLTNSILAPVAACSKTLKVTPSRSTKERLSCLMEGAAKVRPAKAASNDTNERIVRADRMSDLLRVTRGAHLGYEPLYTSCTPLVSPCEENAITMFRETMPIAACSSQVTLSRCRNASPNADKSDSGVTVDACEFTDDIPDRASPAHRRECRAGKVQAWRRHAIRSRRMRQLGFNKPLVQRASTRRRSDEVRFASPRMVSLLITMRANQQQLRSLELQVCGEDPRKPAIAAAGGRQEPGRGWKVVQMQCGGREMQDKASPQVRQLKPLCSRCRGSDWPALGIASARRLICISSNIKLSARIFAYLPEGASSIC